MWCGCGAASVRFPTYKNVWYGTQRRPLRSGAVPYAHRNRDEAGRGVAGLALHGREKCERLFEKLIY